MLTLFPLYSNMVLGKVWLSYRDKGCLWETEQTEWLFEEEKKQMTKLQWAGLLQLFIIASFKGLICDREAKKSHIREEKRTRDPRTKKI